LPIVKFFSPTSKCPEFGGGISAGRSQPKIKARCDRHVAGFREPADDVADLRVDAPDVLDDDNARRGGIRVARRRRITRDRFRARKLGVGYDEYRRIIFGNDRGVEGSQLLIGGSGR